jgi:hypothetical protein
MHTSSEKSGLLSVTTTPEGSMRKPDEVTAMLRLRRPSTIGRRAAAIAYEHKARAHEPPTNAQAVKAVVRGIRRDKGVAPVRKAPATSDVVTAMLAHCPNTLTGKRDRALLALGFAGALFRPIAKGGHVKAEPLSGNAAAAIVKAAALRAGFDSSTFAGHSLRRGFLTSAADAGSSVLKMVEVSRHKSIDMLTTYVQRADRFKNHAGKRFL